MALQVEQSHQQMMQLRLDGDNERRRLEESHHSKLAAEYRHHQSLESQIEQLKIEHIRYSINSLTMRKGLDLIFFMYKGRWILWRHV